MNSVTTSYMQCTQKSLISATHFICAELSRRQILQQSTQELIQQETVIPQPMNFSRDMSNEQLALWLRNHPNLSGTDYQEDVAKIKGTLHIVANTIWLVTDRNDIIITII